MMVWWFVLNDSFVCGEYGEGIIEVARVPSFLVECIRVNGEIVWKANSNKNKNGTIALYNYNTYFCDKANVFIYI